MDIACIQATCNERTDARKDRNYAIFFGRRDVSTEEEGTKPYPWGQAGVAIVVKNTLPLCHMDIQNKWKPG